VQRFNAYLRHLRLPFQLTLAPIFLWGALLSGGRWDAETTSAFLSLHLFLYPAATAFNSAFDKDKGPVAGLEVPPPVPHGLAAFGLAWALVGAVAALPAGTAFAAAFGGAAFWCFAYSHPSTRWKANPWTSGAAIALGQGALGFLAGWLAMEASTGGTAAFSAGAAGAALTALGLYPATQVFQLEEDWERGDRTIALALGPAHALRFGAFCLVLAGVVTAWLVARSYGPPDAFLVMLGYGALAVALVRLSLRPPPEPWQTDLYRPAMAITRWATAGFLLFLGLEAVGSG
jgi:1,4-dihydroxy-2-naphthoate octaprenyltransferase